MIFDTEKLDLFSTNPGVYLMKDSKGVVLYIGKAKNLKQRIRQYFSISGDNRAMVPILTEQIATIDTLLTSDEKQALLLENTLIKKHQPKYNALLKDDKTFLSLFIDTKNPWPKVELVRLKGKPSQKGLYFGPYTNAYAARLTLDLLMRCFPLRQCSDEELKRRKRPCILYEMKRCIAPCVHKCSKEEYDLLVEGVVDFLKGNNKQIARHLKKAMQEASDNLEFEKADAFYQTLKQVIQVSGGRQMVMNPHAKDCDILDLYREEGEVMLVKLLFRNGQISGAQKFFFSSSLDEDTEILHRFLLQHYEMSPSLPEKILIRDTLPDREVLEDILKEQCEKKIKIQVASKKEKENLLKLAYENAKAAFTQEKSSKQQQEKLLLELQEKLGLKRYPKVIECFDTSSTSGSNLVASKVCFRDGIKDPKGKRLFTIKGINKPDDYQALHQTLARRLLKGKEEEDLPDLIIVDGGKGQLNIALEVLEELDIISIEVIALTKDKARHDKGMTQEKIYLPHHKEPILLEIRSSLLFFLQRIRDEAHLAAISFHQKRQRKEISKSTLDELPGIGPKKKAALLKVFGSVEHIRQATIEELKAVKILSEKDIQRLKDL